MSDPGSTRSTSHRRRRRPIGVATIAVLLALCAAACDSAPTKWKAAPSPSAKASAAKGCVATVMTKMSLRQIAGQVMLVGTPNSDPSAIDKVLHTYDIGGVFLNGRTNASAAKMRARIASLQAAASEPDGVRLLIALDQEGGEVQTLRGTDFPPIPTALAQGRLSHAQLSAQTKSWARRLAAVGITLDLAPVADTVATSLGTANPPIGAFHRQYGSNPTAVATDIKTVVTAVQSTGVLTAIKHFPGLGRVHANTDFSTHAVDNITTAGDPNLEPFIAGITDGTGAVMVSSARYPKLDAHAIATFSRPIVTGLLRDQLGFTGLIVSDALGGAAAVSTVPLSQRGVRFIEAGGDLILTGQYQKAPKMIDGLLAAAHTSASFTKQLTTAARYVLQAKYKAGLLSCAPAKS